MTQSRYFAITVPNKTLKKVNTAFDNNIAITYNSDASKRLSASLNDLTELEKYIERKG